MLTVLQDMPLEPYERWALDLIAREYTAANPRYRITGPTGGVLAEGAWAVNGDLHGPVPETLDLQAEQAAEILHNMRAQFLRPYGIRWASDMSAERKARYLALTALAWHRPAAVARATDTLDPWDSEWKDWIAAVDAPERKGLEKAARKYIGTDTPTVKTKPASGIPWAAVAAVTGVIGTIITITIWGRK